MKCLVCLLLALVVVWLGWPRGGNREKGNWVVELSRRVLDREWRAMPEGEMTLREMERYAADLSNEELWVELERACEDWLENNKGRKLFGQPSLAIMLAREIGQRDRESAMKKVAAWLDEEEKRLFENGEEALEEEFDFFELRVRVAGFAGWVAEDPKEAISRLIESRQNEERDWPVVNQGMLFRLNMPRADERCAMESVLRDGFREIAAQDFQYAYRLVLDGMGAWAFDANKMFEVLVESKEGAARREFLTDLIQAPSWADLLLRKKEKDRVLKNEGVFEIRNERDLIEISQWISGFPDELSYKQEFERGQLDVFVRTRPDEARRVLEAGVPNRANQWALLTGLLLADRKNYDLIPLVDDEDKADVIGALINGSQDVQFGPITGMDDPGAVNLEELRSAVEAATMADSVRDEIRDLLGAHRDSPD